MRNRTATYTYGHGFSMLFLSQVLGEEEDAERRQALIDVLTRAVKFSGDAQTPCGGWGYISSKDSGGFDEGSTTITQVQGLRGCRNAGIPVPKEYIDQAVKYINACTNAQGGVAYSWNRAARPGPAGHFGGSHRLPVQCRRLRRQIRPQDDGVLPRPLGDVKNKSAGEGHWWYSHYYFSQVLYREGGKAWDDYRNAISARLLAEQKPSGEWDGEVCPVFATAIV